MESTEQKMALRHEEEWRRFREEVLTPLYEKVAGGDEKNAKSLADIIKICQEGERKAHVFGGATDAADSSLQVCFETD